MTHTYYQLLAAALLAYLCLATPLIDAAFGRHKKHSSTSSDKSSDVVRIVSSSKNGDLMHHAKTVKLQPTSDLPSTDNANVDIVISIDPSTTYQSIVGFGGAITEAAASVIQQLPKSKQDEIVDLYYSQEGNRYSIGRLHMNSCDFSVKSYSFDDEDGDFDLKHFDTKLQHDVDNGVIPFVRQAIKRTTAAGRELQLFYSPWSPPAWMKTNGQMTGSANPCLKSEKHAEAWAQYFVKYAESMHKNYDIDFWGVTVQNEPGFDAPWEACMYTPEQERDFIADHLGPALHSSAVTKDLKLMIHDHNKDNINEMADAILADDKASQYVWGIGLHWYSGDFFDNVAAVGKTYPDKALFGTEACVCPYTADSWSAAEKYAHDIIGDLVHGARGWTDWNIALNTEGGPNHLGNLCGAGIIVDTKEGTYRKEPVYYAMGHFSRFLPPGAKRVQHSVAFGSDAKRDFAYANAPPADNGFTQPDQAQGDMPWQQGNGIGIGLEFVAFVVDSEKDTQHYAIDKHANASNGEVVLVIMNPTDNERIIRLATPDSGADLYLDPHSINTLSLDGAAFEKSKTSDK